MKKTLLPGIIAVLGVLSSCTPAYAAEPTSKQLLHVAMSFDDGGHAFMPKLELSSPPVRKVRITQDPEPPREDWGGGIMIRAGGDKADRTSFGLFKLLTPLTGRKSSVDFSLDGFAGATLRKSVPVAAVTLGARKKLFDQLSLGLHVGFVTTQGLPIDLCFGGSANVRFNTGGTNPSASAKQVISSLEK
jgi:hypothetical protein